jgi:adenylate kinase
MGTPGAGKSVQAKLLAEYKGWVHVSPGELMRRRGLESKEMATGDLVQSGVVERMVEDEMKQVPPERTVILDGFPRELNEAEWMDGRLGDWQRQVRVVLLVEVSREESAKRLILRGRPDDTGAVQQERWHEYNTQTRLVLDFYAKQNLLKTVDGVGTVEEVAQRVMEAVK